MTYSLIQFYPHFEERLRDALQAIVGEEAEARVDIGLAKDGSGVGGKLRISLRTPLQLTCLYVVAALCALQAAKQGTAKTRE